MNVLRVSRQPLVAAKLTRIRDRRTPRDELRRLVREVTILMVGEAALQIPTTPVRVRTPLEETDGVALAPVTVVPILRAGLAMAEGVSAVIPEARVGMLGVRRHEITHEAEPYYEKLPPDLHVAPVLVVDPMLATGGSAMHALNVLEARGARSIAFFCLLATPEGVARVTAAHPDVPLHAAALDRGLDEHAFIRPGLGDAGDRLFGTEE